MAVISMKALLESGVHFGHRTNKWDPRTKPYIFTERNGIHIIDLQQTVKLLNHALTWSAILSRPVERLCLWAPNVRRRIRLRKSPQLPAWHQGQQRSSASVQDVHGGGDPSVWLQLRRMAFPRFVFRHPVRAAGLLARAGPTSGLRGPG